MASRHFTGECVTVTTCLVQLCDHGQFRGFTDALTLRKLAPSSEQRKCFSLLNELTFRSKWELQLKQLLLARNVLDNDTASEKSCPYKKTCRSIL